MQKFVILWRLCLLFLTVVQWVGHPGHPFHSKGRFGHKPWACFFASSCALGTEKEISYIKQQCWPSHPKDRPSGFSSCEFQTVTTFTALMNCAHILNNGMTSKWTWPFHGLSYVFSSLNVRVFKWSLFISSTIDWTQCTRLNQSLPTCSCFIQHHHHIIYTYLYYPIIVSSFAFADSGSASGSSAGSFKALRINGQRQRESQRVQAKPIYA